MVVISEADKMHEKIIFSLALPIDNERSSLIAKRGQYKGIPFYFSDFLNIFTETIITDRQILVAFFKRRGVGRGYYSS